MVPPGGSFHLKQDGYEVTGPHLSGAECVLRVTKGEDVRTVPLSSPVGLCPATAVVLCHDATMTVKSNDLLTKYRFPSLEVMETTRRGPPRAFGWLAAIGLVLSLLGLGQTVRRVRVNGGAGPYRGAAPLSVTSVAPRGIAAASAAALLLVVPFATAVAAKLVTNELLH